MKEQIDQVRWLGVALSQKSLLIHTGLLARCRDKGSKRNRFNGFLNFASETVKNGFSTTCAFPPG